MPATALSPEKIREGFRRYLIQRNGSFVSSPSEEVKSLRFFVETLEEFISQQETEEIGSLTTYAATLAQQDQGTFWSDHFPVHWDDIFRSHLRSAVVVSAMSVTEALLAQVCRDVEIITGAHMEDSHRSGSILKRAKPYLGTAANFQQPSASTWAELRRIYDLRNVFVHRGGYLPSYGREAVVRELTRSRTDVSEQHGSLTLQAEFCPYALNVVDSFFTAITIERTSLCGRVREQEKL